MAGQNVCFGCNSVPDVKTCDKKDCFAHEYRSEVLELDTDYNSNASLIKMREEMKLGIRTSSGKVA